MKAVYRSIKPYWLYLIIIGKKMIEVGKTFPKADDWNKEVFLHCSKDMKSFKRIPEKDREWMRKYLGKVACRFVCDKIDEYPFCPYICEDGTEAPELSGYEIPTVEGEKTGMDYCEAAIYGNRNPLYFWHISDLKIYDKPRELSEFYKPCENLINGSCKIPHPFNPCGKIGITFERYGKNGENHRLVEKNACLNVLHRPPQSWCYVEVQG